MAKRSTKKAKPYRLKAVDKRFLKRVQSVYDQLVPRAVQQLPTQRIAAPYQLAIRRPLQPFLVDTIVFAQEHRSIEAVRAHILDSENPAGLFLLRDVIETLQFAVRRRAYPIEDASTDDFLLLLELLLWYEDLIPDPPPLPPRDHGPLANSAYAA